MIKFKEWMLKNELVFPSSVDKEDPTAWAARGAMPKFSTEPLPGNTKGMKKKMKKA